MGKFLGFLLLICFCMCLVVKFFTLLIDLLFAIWPVLFIAAILPPTCWLLIKIFQNRKQREPAESHPKDIEITGCRPEEDADLIIETEEQLQNFVDSHQLVRSFYTKVVGTSYPNDDGSSRQEILSRCSDGEQLTLNWQTFNGEPACAVISDHGQIGFLKADLAADLYRDYIGLNYESDDFLFFTFISNITGGENGLYYGCNIKSSIYAPIPPYRDEMFPVAVDFIFETGRASITQLQKHLHLGYTRASRLMDELEEHGIVGPFRGSKPREILISKQQWDSQKTQ